MRAEIKIKQLSHTAHISISSSNLSNSNIVTIWQNGTDSYVFLNNDQLRELIANFQSVLDAVTA